MDPVPQPVHPCLLVIVLLPLFLDNYPVHRWLFLQNKWKYTVEVENAVGSVYQSCQKVLKIFQLFYWEDVVLLYKLCRTLFIGLEYSKIGILLAHSKK